jgi:hypothetical protein
MHQGIWGAAALFLALSGHGNTTEPGYAATVRRLLAGAESFLHEGKTGEGITPERRIIDTPSEGIRLNVLPQALGYLELYRHDGQLAHLQEAVDRMDYVLLHWDQAVRHRSYDGMLAYALLEFASQTGKIDYLAHAELVLAELMALPEKELRGNTGLMMGMGLARAYQLSPKPETLAKLADILAIQKAYQNPDGSFPHAYDGADLHYSSWMAMELILMKDCLGQTLRAEIEALLAGLRAFLSGRIALQGSAVTRLGEPSYQELVCSPSGVCQNRFYYAKATASQPEYDTRGWSNEASYEILAFDRLGLLPQAEASASFLAGLENDRAFPDKWAYPNDPVTEPGQYALSTDARSVLRTSVIFWSLAVTANRGLAR